MNDQVEKKYGHGGLPANILPYGYRKITKAKLGRSSVPFDWVKGYDIEDTVKLIRKNQGVSYSCGGQAGGYWLEAHRKLDGNLEQISAKSMYAPKAYPGGGMTINDLEAQIESKGGNLESAIPSYENGQLPSELFMEDKSWITPSALEDALIRSGYVAKRINHDMNSMAEAIRDCGGVIVMIAGQNNGTWLASNPLPPSTSNTAPIWYHYIYFKGARLINGVKYLQGLNSWGEDVGDNGVQNFGQEYVESKYLVHATSFIKKPKPVPVTSLTLWDKIWALIVYNLNFKVA